MVTALYENDHLKEATKIARQILFDLAHSIGKQDAREFHQKLNLTNPMEKLSVGPIHFSHTGWAFVDISPESNPSPDDNFFLVYDHIYSFEAEAWIKENKKSDFCVCVMNAGYSSGWCEESFGVPLVASELICKAKGDEACRFVMAPPSRIEDHITKELAHYKPEQRATNRQPEVPALLQWKQRGDALRESEDKFRSAFEFSAIDMAMVTLDGICLRANNSFCKITGYSNDELKKIPLKEIY
jgi:PAS domain-containing protein